MAETKRFTLTEEHIKLLQHMHVHWQYCEYGAPEIDPKRPYGRSDTEASIFEILGWARASPAALSAAEGARAEAIHGETETALEIVLRTRAFLPGVYERTASGDGWVLRGWGKR